MSSDEFFTQEKGGIIYEKEYKWKIGDIIQIDPDYDSCFGSCFMIVTEPKSWGAQGYFQAPGIEGQAFYRVKFEHGQKVGRAAWVFPDISEDL